MVVNDAIGFCFFGLSSMFTQESFLETSSIIFPEDLAFNLPRVQISLFDSTEHIVSCLISLMPCSLDEICKNHSFKSYLVDEFLHL